MTTTTSKPRGAVVSDRKLRPMMGLPVWEALPARDVPYSLSDPFILLHEASLHPSQTANLDTEHPHRGFDNLCAPGLFHLWFRSRKPGKLSMRATGHEIRRLKPSCARSEAKLPAWRNA